MIIIFRYITIFLILLIPSVLMAGEVVLGYDGGGVSNESQIAEINSLSNTGLLCVPSDSMIAESMYVLKIGKLRGLSLIEAIEVLFVKQT